MDTGGYNLAFEKRDGYLYARVQADFMDLDTAKTYLREVADRLLSDGSDKLMLDRNVPTMLPPGSLYFATQALGEYVGEAKVALVNVYEPLQKEMDFAELLCHNRGLQFQVFDAIPPAEAWLLANN